MVDQRSPLAGHDIQREFLNADTEISISIQERKIGGLFQIAGFPDTFDDAAQSIATIIGLPAPTDYCTSGFDEENVVFMTSPETWLCLCDDPSLIAKANNAIQGTDLFLADMSHSRARIRLSGKNASILLQRGLPIDLSDAVFAQFNFVQSAIHGMPALIHRLQNSSGSEVIGDDPALDILIPRTFAVSFWKWLITHAEALPR